MPLNRNQDFMFEDTTTLTTNAQSLKGALNEVNASLAAMPKLGYTSTNITSWLNRIEGQYVNVKDFGAKGDCNGTATGTDNTAFIQAAIDYAFSINAPLYFPQGRYLVNGTLYLPQTLIIIGANNNANGYLFPGRESTEIVCNTSVLFMGKPNTISGGLAQLTIKVMNMSFLNIFNASTDTPTSTGATWISTVNLKNSYIFQCGFLHFGMLILGTTSYITKIDKCMILAVRKCVISSFAEDGLAADVSGTLIDTDITNCYINGKPTMNATAFKLIRPGMASICDNFIDFFKFSIQLSKNSSGAGADGLLIRGNKFDYSHTVLILNGNGVTVSNNIFHKIDHADMIASFPYADSYMTTNNTACILLQNKITTDSSLSISGMLIHGNTVLLCDYFLNTPNAPYNVNNVICKGNTYDANIITKVVWNLYHSGIANDGSGNFIEELMYQTYTTLPSPNLTANAPIVSFNGHIAYQGGKLWINNNGTWNVLSSLPLS